MGIDNIAEEIGIITEKRDESKDIKYIEESDDIIFSKHE